MKFLGGVLITVSLIMAISVVLIAFAPQLFPSITTNVRTQMEALNASVNISYFLPVVLIGACFIQILGWGLLILGRLNDFVDLQPITPKRIGM